VLQTEHPDTGGGCMLHGRVAGTTMHVMEGGRFEEADFDFCAAGIQLGCLLQVSCRGPHGLILHIRPTAN
jgi:hypothetical protein